MDVTRKSAQHLAQKGATFEGRSLIFKRAKELSAEKALQQTEEGRPVEAHLGDQKFPIRSGSDLVELDFFKAHGSSEGLKDPVLARTLRELNYDAEGSFSQLPACIPMQLYKILSRPTTTAHISHPQLRGSGERLDREGMLALGFFASEGLVESTDLAHPERAESLKQLQAAGLLNCINQPFEKYLAFDQNVRVATESTSEGVYLEPKILEQPEMVANRLEELSDLEELQKKHFPGDSSLPMHLQQIVWDGTLNQQRTEQLFQSFSQRPEGVRELTNLLDLLPEGKLPTSLQTQQFMETRRALPEGDKLRSGEFQWLTSDTEQFPNRLTLLADSRKLMGPDAQWRRDSLETLEKLEARPELLAYSQKLNNTTPLSRANFELASTIAPDDQSRFTQLYQQASLTKVADLPGLWKDAGKDWANTQKKLLGDGLDPTRALLAASALGDDPSAAMLEMAGQLGNSSNAYSQNPYTRALKVAGQLEPEVQQAFGEIFAGQQTSGWENTWRQTHNSEGGIDKTCLDILKEMKSQGMSHSEFYQLRASGASPQTLLDNLRETPDQKALRAQRWVAYTSRQLNHSQAAVSGYAISKNYSYQKQQQELKELDRWFVPAHEYESTMQRQQQSNRNNGLYGESLSQTAHSWDQKMANLQSGQIPWGEPPLS